MNSLLHLRPASAEGGIGAGADRLTAPGAHAGPGRGRGAGRRQSGGHQLGERDRVVRDRALTRLGSDRCAPRVP